MNTVGFVPIESRYLFSFKQHLQCTPKDEQLKPSSEVDTIQLPQSMSSMMREIASTIIEARERGLSIGIIDFPLPVTGGTELDDWPGGIKQKYTTLKPLLKEVMTYLKFSIEAMNTQAFLGEFGEEDAVGKWQDNGIQICCFPTVDSIPYLQQMMKWSDNSTILVLINPQFFLDPFSSKESKRFVDAIPSIYQLQSLSLKGPGAIPIKGILFRKFPSLFKAVRKLIDGSYVLLGTFETKPSQAELDKVYYEDSKVRDKDVSFFDRLRRQIGSFN